jgi:hypothetical protein
MCCWLFTVVVMWSGITACWDLSSESGSCWLYCAVTSSPAYLIRSVFLTAVIFHQCCKQWIMLIQTFPAVYLGAQQVPRGRATTVRSWPLTPVYVAYLLLGPAVCQELEPPLGHLPFLSFIWPLPPAVHFPLSQIVHYILAALSFWAFTLFFYLSKIHLPDPLCCLTHSELL